MPLRTPPKGPFHPLHAGDGGGRSRGELRTTSFVRLRKLPVDRALMLDVIDLGDAETLLNNPRHFRETARRHLKRGIPPTEDGWGGCLGRYQSALCKATREIESATSGTGFASRSGAGIGRADDDGNSWRIEAAPHTGRVKAEGRERSEPPRTKGPIAIRRLRHRTRRGRS
jgi:hypothetical protein